MPCRTSVPTACVVAVLLTALLAGCAGSPPESQARASGKARPALQTVRYQPPAADASGARGFIVSQPPSEVERQLATNVAAIDGAQLVPSRTAGVVVVRYSGDPRDYIDCGTISLQDAASGSAKQVNAAEDKVQLPRTSRYPDGRLERKMRLDSRTTLRLTDLPGGTTLIDDSTRYVVTKEVHTFAFGGGKDGKDKWLGATRETVAFDTGEAGTFKARTTCIATGRLGQALLQGLATPAETDANPAPAIADPPAPALIPAPTELPAPPSEAS